MIESDLRQQRLEQLDKLLQDGAGSLEEVRRAKADSAVAKLEVDAAREEIKLRQLELREIEARLTQRRITSPIDGVITEADSGRVRLDVIINNSDGNYRSGVRCDMQSTSG